MCAGLLDCCTQNGGPLPTGNNFPLKGGKFSNVRVPRSSNTSSCPLHSAESHNCKLKNSVRAHFILMSDLIRPLCCSGKVVSGNTATTGTVRLLTPQVRPTEFDCFSQS